MTSRVERAFQRERGANDAERGWLGDPLRLPYARILQEVTRVRVSEAYRRMVQMAAATFSGQGQLFLDARAGLHDADFLIVSRAFDQLVADMEDRPYMDLLGPVYMEIAHKLDRDHRGEFYTPHSVSALLARLGFDRAMFQPGQVLECNEPAAGTGGMVLAAAQVLAEQGISPMHTRWVVQDLSALACHGAYVNTTLWGIPAVVVCGDTLRMTQEWAWKNIHYDNALPYPSAEDIREREDSAMRLEWMLQVLRGLVRAGMDAA